MKIEKYDRVQSVEYAKKWALSRNPLYYNFDEIGGDCTNFVSQCIYAGSKKMNYQKYGWYYINANQKSASWTGVEYLYNFLKNNNGIGPFGKETNESNIELGDIVQLSFDGNKFEHSLFIIKSGIVKSKNDIFVATHTFDSLSKNINSYNFKKIRYIHIEGVRK